MKNSKKKTMRFYLTLAGIKVLIKVLQLCGRNATHVPGRKAINICPDFLDQIDKPEFIENNQYNYIFFLRLIHKTKAG